jgi:Spy/CpxP family protein refolding chaperone
MTRTSLLPGQVTAGAAVLLVGLVVGAPARAGQAFKWWQSDHFQQELRLTGEQSRRLEEIFQEALPALRAEKKALDDAEATFERLVERGDEHLVLAQVERVERARSELNVTRTMMLVRMRRVLTADQWAKFTALHEAEERARANARDQASVRGR